MPHPGCSARPLDKEPHFRSMKRIKGRFSAGAAQPTKLGQASGLDYSAFAAN
jgi:hypothetical protein